MGLARQASDTPASDHTLGTATLGDGNGVNHLVGLEHTVHSHSLQERRVQTGTANESTGAAQKIVMIGPTKYWSETHCQRTFS